MKTDAEFYRRRLAEERLATQEANTPEAKALHRALADNYAAKLREIGEPRQILPQD